jgi:hypothetical protein
MKFGRPSTTAPMIVIGMGYTNASLLSILIFSMAASC